MGYGQYSSNSRGKQNPLRNAVVDKPKREVFPTSEIPHKWAHATQACARNAQGNLFFNGSTIYSYRESWPLARIYEREDFGKLALTNCNKYSVTTAAHQHAINVAASHLPQIAVPYVGAGAKDSADAGRHSENLAHLLKVADEETARAMRAMTVSRAEHAIGQARAAIEDMRRYLAFFNIRRKAPAMRDAEWTAAIERARRIENPNPASMDKRERAKATRKAAAEVQARKAAELAAVHKMAARTAWRLDCDEWKIGMWGQLHSGPIMLRVLRDEIQTSMGARVPLAAAPMVWNLVERARRNGGYAREGFKAGFTDSTGSVRNYTRPVIRIGDYPLDRIDADGTLHAGCHVIPYSEIAAMARQLGLTNGGN